MQMTKDTYDAMGNYENAVIDQADEGIMTAVDHDSILEGIRVNGGSVEGIENGLVDMVQTDFKRRAVSTEAIDFIAEGENFKNGMGLWETANRDLVIPKKWSDE